MQSFVSALFKGDKENESKEDEYFKILPKSMKLRDFQYHLDVENILERPFDDSNTCGAGGLYFCRLGDIKHWLNLHNNLEIICRVKLLPKSKLVIMDTKCKTDRMILTDAIPVQDFLIKHNLLIGAIQFDKEALRHIRNPTLEIIKMLEPIFKSKLLTLLLNFFPILSTEFIQWAIINIFEWNITVCAKLALYGYLEVLQWAKNNECPWNSNTCAYAARNGHLEILQWARINGCEWDWWTCENAVIVLII